jgi:alkylation response protein AidB-like acyl-CoA dehydrogenase
MPHIYGLSPRDAELVGRASTIAREVLSRYAADVDAKGRFPEESLDALAKDGFLGLCVPTELGGMGAGVRAFVAVVEELAQSCASTAMVFVMHVSAQQAIAASSTFSDKAAVLRSIAGGRHLTTLALSEKGSRSHFWAPVSRLEPRAGGYVTTAQKSWATSAGRADSYVSAGQKPGAGSPLESTLYFVRRGAPGVKVVSGFDGLGLRGNDSAPVSMEGLAIAEGDLITANGEGAKGMLEVILPWFAIGSAAMSNGLCRAAVGATAAHLSGAGFEHLGGTKLRELPTLRARLAEMSVRTEQARALLGYTLGEMEQPSEITPLYVLQTRLASLQAADAVTDAAMKACGGAAFSKHLPLERIFRDARAGWVMAPTVDHLADFVGKALTGLPLF